MDRGNHLFACAAQRDAATQEARTDPLALPRYNFARWQAKFRIVGAGGKLTPLCRLKTHPR